MNGKVRRIDFHPVDWLDGTAELSLAERGVYITACALIYARGGPIPRDHLRQRCAARGNRFATLLEHLLALDKLHALDGDMLDQRRCEAELQRASERVETAIEKAGKRWGRDTPDRPAGDANPSLIRPKSVLNRALISPKSEASCHDNSDLGYADAYANQGTKNQQPRFKDSSKGNSGLGCALESEASTEPKSVEATVAETLDVIALNQPGLRNGKYDPVAYGKAVTRNKRERWHNNLATFVGVSLPGGIDAKMPAWEAIETSRSCGSRAATPPDIRRAVDQLSRMRNSTQQAEAAE